MQVQTLKGFRDFLPFEAKKRDYVISTLKKVFQLYGFEPLETPAIEYEEILTGKYGDEGDQLMYKFQDKGERKVALRYDQTVPLARVISQYQNDLPLPFKRYQMQNVWRAENTQKGRYREFLQCDADIVGSYSPTSDAEIISLAITSLKELGFKKFKILINDRMLFTNLPNFGINDEEVPMFVRAIDKLKKIGREKVIEELIKNGVDSQKASYILDTLENEKPTQRINDILEALEKMKVDKKFIEFLPTLARGLNYYTGMIFEVEIDGYDTGSVAGGGRYDNLIGVFAGKDIPAVGFAFGFDRLMEAMEELKLFPSELPSTKILVTNTNNYAPTIVNTLREEGINTELYLDEKDLEKQLKYADKKRIPYVLILNEDKFLLKDMTTGKQETLTLEQVVEKFK